MATTSKLQIPRKQVKKVVVGKPSNLKLGSTLSFDVQDMPSESSGDDDNEDGGAKDYYWSD
jgi:hypothetical protein